MPVHEIFTPLLNRLAVITRRFEFRLLSHTAPGSDRRRVAANDAPVVWLEIRCEGVPVA